MPGPHYQWCNCNGAVLKVKGYKFSVSPSQQPHPLRCLRLCISSRCVMILCHRCTLVIEIGPLQVINVSAILEKLQSCITWTKKASKGWRVYSELCAQFNEAVVAFITPVKTKFTSVGGYCDCYPVPGNISVAVLSTGLGFIWL